MSITVFFGLFKVLHLLGVILLIGNVTITAFWKVFADRTSEPRVVSFAQHLVTITDWVFTLGGVVLLSVGGFGAAMAEGLDPFGSAWLIEAETLFAVSGAIWLFILVPIQIRQARQARAFSGRRQIPDVYWKDGRRWLFWGVVATCPLVIAVYVMVVKP